jgi:predicted enzyme related to lactoylglutathione lyase
MPVTGIGGLFFRAKDPDALTAWYRRHLGITPESYEPWQQQAGPTMFMPFKADTSYFAADKQWMLNLRVSEIDTLIARLRDAGVEVQTDPTWDTAETGRFARIHDPEGNAIELWQPPVE